MVSIDCKVIGLLSIVFLNADYFYSTDYWISHCWIFGPLWYSYLDMRTDVMEKEKCPMIT